MYYDNSCNLLRHLRNIRNDYLLTRTTFVVDAFHFNVHSKDDTLCRTFCDPGLYADLKTGDGKWAFNSSAAEQVNVWIGGYQAVVKDMRSERYRFFLDEVITLRNRFVCNELEAKGHGPHLVPHSDLMLEKVQLTTSSS